LAFNLAAQALKLDSSRTDVLAVAERSAMDDQLPALEELTIGFRRLRWVRTGNAPCNYRAARQLEKRSVIDRALWARGARCSKRCPRRASRSS